MSLLGTSIFWTTVLAVPTILIVLTVIGRVWSKAFPDEYQPAARIFLSPALGLASLILVSALIGRSFPLGDTVLTPIFVIIALLYALKVDPARSDLPHHLLTVAGFGIVCGSGILVVLYFQGALNAHNDTFTYLAHGDWLQHHAFGNKISFGDVTPASSQVAMYQKFGFRMGASYFLGFFQALLNIRWAYDIYPSVVIAAMSSCCLALGFPLAPLLMRLSSGMRTGLLALPSFSLGGLAFGSHFGFLAQTVGLAAAATAVFAVGAALSSLSTRDWRISSIFIVSLPVALCLSATIFSYSEMSPFLVATVGLSGLWFAIKSNAWRNIVVFSCMTGLVVLALTNVELLRAYQSLKTQSGVVVGSPVPWSFLDYIGHAFGVRAGPWESDTFSKLPMLWSGLFALCMAFGLHRIKWTGVRDLWPLIMPSLIMLCILLTAFIHFRYFVASPFPVGKGQSWSQFKLAEWAHPFVAVFVAFGVSIVLVNLGRKQLRLLFTLIVLSGFGSLYICLLRIRPIMHYYENTSNLDFFYHQFRSAIFNQCPLQSAVYLELGGGDEKFRQMAALFLADREVKADWANDSYIAGSMPKEKVSLLPEKGDCLVRPNDKEPLKRSELVIGHLRVEHYDGAPRVQLASVRGGHGLEADREKSWYWVEKRISFEFKQSEILDGKLSVQFNYAARPGASLRARVIDKAEPSRVFLDVDLVDQQGSFSRIVALHKVHSLAVTIDTMAEGPALSDKDTRKAAFRVENFSARFKGNEGDIR